MIGADGRGHPVAAAAVPGHLRLELQPPVSPLGVEGGRDFLRALDFHQFARLEIEFRKEGFSLSPGDLIKTPAVEQPPHAIGQSHPQQKSKSSHRHFADPEVVQMSVGTFPGG